MTPRGTIIAALVVVELAIMGESVVAVNGMPAPPAAFRLAAAGASGPNLVEDGPHRIFEAAPRPALTVDIGYADLTIITQQGPDIDVSIAASTSYGVFRATAPIAARADGRTVRITTTRGNGWTIGDDRMVTVLVPPQTEVTVIRAGDIRANGLRAQASFTSVGQGSVTIDDYAAPSLVASSRGRISLHAIVSSRLDATSSESRVEGTALQVRDGSVESDGRVMLGFATGTDTLVTAETKNGHVRVSGLSPAAPFANGRDSGDGGDADSALQTVRVGSGNGRLTVHTSDGNIDLTRDG
jgi:hypothetical protein